MKYWNERISTIEPYTPGEQPQDSNWIKLNTNENPWEPAPSVLESIMNAAAANLNRYPDPNARLFCSAAAQYCKVPESYIFAGNGSDEILAFAFGALFKPPIVFPDVTYSFYPIYAELWSLPYETVPLSDNFVIYPEMLLRPCGGVMLCNPNAPTGIALPRERVLEIVSYHQKQNTVVIVDEAYVEFGAESVVRDTEQYDNLLVVRTLSKSKSIAGLRAGYAVGNPDLIAGLKRIRDMVNSYTMNTVSQLAGAAALLAEEYYAAKTSLLIRTREATRDRLIAGGWQVLPSSSNFLFMSLPGTNGVELYSAFKERRILVRYWDKPKIRNHIRVTIGTPEEMDIFCQTALELAGSNRNAQGA
ncbi:MAG TPA: histidinol-phosphate transaminase [Spirochaetia bacterium]|nr:histidinol-phosphate transaminase [Spirochaetales bacterium]HRS66190.1 histidinol-phosphate transaminase [Spirochaetia bacterium]HOT58162.1 histidinol-phosphate transaminase [Spirochaetales bacterium]HPD79883.1 histidinol-phosphate transaminase [Spirochaetales bacterium]HQK33262.1 histidinol-phosphate transaminase [Spirochaetales bacterium]